jgi:hypothetical protein
MMGAPELINIGAAEATFEAAATLALVTVTCVTVTWTVKSAAWPGGTT